MMPPAAGAQGGGIKPLPAGILENTGINISPYDSNPVALSKQDLVALSVGTRFIPARHTVLSPPELKEAFRLFEHRLAVAVMFDDPPPPCFVGSTLVPYKPRPSGYYMELDPGPAKAEVFKWQKVFIERARKLQQLHVGGRRSGTPANLPHGAYQTLREWARRTDVVLRNSDKNLGPTLMSKGYYVSCCLKHLEDTASYTCKGVLKPGSGREGMYVETLRDMLADILLKDGRMTQGAVDSLLGSAQNYRLPRFYIMPKLHKMSGDRPFEARPIVSQSGSLTEVASKMLSQLLNTVVGPQHWWALKDTPSLIRLLEQFKVPVGDELHELSSKYPDNGEMGQIWLISMDVTALYPNMDIDATIAHVVHAVQSYIMEQTMENGDSEESVTSHLDPAETTALVAELLTFVLKHTYFTFDAGDGKGRVLYQQIAGASMGSSCIPPAANIYMAALAKDVVRRWMDGSLSDTGSPRKLLLAKGFIDDLFMVLYGTRADVDELAREIEQQDPTGKIRLTVTASTTEVPYLDLWVRYTPTSRLTGKLEVAPYAKELNKYLYIPPWSGHTPHSLSAFIAGEAKRLIRNSSNEEDATYACTRLMCHLVARGYGVEAVFRQLAKASYARREQYLMPKASTVDPKRKGRVVALTLPFQSFTRTLPTRQFAREVQSAVTTYTTARGVRVVVGWSNDSNLQSFLRLQWPKGPHWQAGNLEV
jgi:hypothetical protein